MDINWLLEQRIIHRGMITPQCPDHAKESFLTCLDYPYPIEVDLLFLADGEVVVWRDGPLKDFGITQDSRMLSSLSQKEISSLCSLQINESSQLKQMMTFSSFLNMIDGKIGLLIEIKEPYKSSKIYEHVAIVLNLLEGYKGKYALHSANPMVLKQIRTIKKDVPIGQISWSFDSADVIAEYKNLHQSFQFLDIIVPDFLGYKIGELKDIETQVRVKKVCKKFGLPLLGWTVRNREDERIALDYCDNMIIEGSIGYLK